MGVSVRLTKNTRIHIPFWVAIPVWLIVGLAYLVFGVLWLLAQLVMLLVKAARRGGARRAVPAVRGAPDTATALTAVGEWRGPVRRVRRTDDELTFSMYDPQRWKEGEFRIPAPIPRELAAMMAGDVVQVMLNQEGRDVSVEILSRADEGK